MRIFLSILLLIINPVYANIEFLAISDIHYGDNIITKDGADTDPILLNKALNEFSRLSENVNFILALGDFPEHSLLYLVKKPSYLKTVFHGLYQANKSHKPMFYITGNNDSLQGNALSFSWENKSPLTYATDWQGSCAYCEGLIIDKTHMKDGGYYSSYLTPNNKDVQLIALNSIQFMKLSFYMRQYPNQKKDALEQLHWLKKQLSTHHAKQLLIAMHTPPGLDYKGHMLWHKAYLKEFIKVLADTHKNYQQISLLTSHTHMDEIRKIQLNDGTRIYAYATPSVSPSHHNNPSMKVFNLNAELQLQDYTTYYTTNYSQWTNDQYAAKKDIFPECKNSALATCFNNYGNHFICKRLVKGRFYGVKSLRVNGDVCGITYPVN